MFYRYYVNRMTDGYITSIVDQALKNTNLLSMVETVSPRSVDGRREWIEHSVLPALSKLFVYDREYFVKFVEQVKRMLD